MWSSLAGLGFVLGLWLWLRASAVSVGSRHSKRLITAQGCTVGGSFIPAIFQPGSISSPLRARPPSACCCQPPRVHDVLPGRLSPCWPCTAHGQPHHGHLLLGRGQGDVREPCAARSQHGRHHLFRPPSASASSSRILHPGSVRISIGAAPGQWPHHRLHRLSCCSLRAEPAGRRRRYQPEHRFVPLTMPGMCGPGTMALVISGAAQIAGAAGGATTASSSMPPW